MRYDAKPFCNMCRRRHLKSEICRYPLGGFMASQEAIEALLTSDENDRWRITWEDNKVAHVEKVTDAT